MYNVTVTIVFDPPPVPRRHLREMTREAHRASLRHWQSEFLPDHFKPGARQKYGYQPRSAGYLRSKERRATPRQDAQGRRRRTRVLMGGRQDLVYTGLLRRLVTRPQHVKAYPTRATLTMHGPRYVGMRRRNPNRPDYAAEVKATTPGEAKAMTDKWEETLTTAILRYSGRRVNRTRR